MLQKREVVRLYEEMCCKCDLFDPKKVHKSVQTTDMKVTGDGTSDDLS